MFRFALVLLLGATSLSFTLFPVFAEALVGKKNIRLVEENGTSHLVGTVIFEAVGSVTSYKIAWDENKFTDHFLSMRPFKCFEGTTKFWCRVPYPYSIERKISKSDLTDLEYDLLFIWKGATEYGINMWNGVYYQLELKNGRIVGQLNDMDMDKLSAPPEDGNLRPIREVDLEPGEPSSHWLPTIMIE